MVNPFLPSSAQLSLEHINLGVWLCVVVLILLSLPAFVLREDYPLSKVNRI
jgi:hypothetical protein